MDIFSDIGFFIERLTLGDKIVAWCMFVSIILPMLVNAYLVGRIMYDEFGDAQVVGWFKSNQITSSVLMALSLTKLNVLLFLTSRVFGSSARGDRFYAPFSARATEITELYGLCGNALVQKTIHRHWTLFFIIIIDRLCLILCMCVCVYLGGFAPSCFAAVRTGSTE